MMYAAENGAVQLSQDGKAWTISSTGDMAAWDKTDEVTRLAGRSLGVVTSNSSFKASPKWSGLSPCHYPSKRRFGAESSHPN